MDANKPHAPTLGEPELCHLLCRQCRVGGQSGVGGREGDEDVGMSAANATASEHVVRPIKVWFPQKAPGTPPGFAGCVFIDETTCHIPRKPFAQALMIRRAEHVDLLQRGLPCWISVEESDGGQWIITNCMLMDDGAAPSRPSTGAKEVFEDELGTKRRTKEPTAAEATQEHLRGVQTLGQRLCQRSRQCLAAKQQRQRLIHALKEFIFSCFHMTPERLARMTECCQRGEFFYEYRCETEIICTQDDLCEAWSEACDEIHQFLSAMHLSCRCAVYQESIVVRISWPRAV